MFRFVFYGLTLFLVRLAGLLAKDVPLVAVVTEEVKEQLVEASAVTQKAFTTYRREAEAEEHQAAADGTPVPTADKSQEEGEMSVIITIMQPILRLMQLLCENHNRDLQVSLFLSQDFHFASATAGPLLPLALPPRKHFLICVLILSYRTRLQRNETAKKIDVVCRTFVLQLCLYLVRLGLVSLLEVCRVIIMAGASGPRQKTSSVHRFTVCLKLAVSFIRTGLAPC